MVELGEFLDSGCTPWHQHPLQSAITETLKRLCGKHQDVGQGGQLVNGMASFVLSPRPSILSSSSLCKGSGLGRL